MRIKRTVIAAVIIVLALTSAYLSIGSLRTTNITSTSGAYRYSDAAQVKLSRSEIGVLLGTLGESINASDLSLLQSKFANVAQLNPPNSLIGHYLRTLTNLSGNLTQMKGQLSHARSALISGNRTKARALLEELRRQETQSGALIQSSLSLIAQIGNQYQIDTSTSLAQLDTLTKLYDDYSTQINQLNSELNTQATLIQTTLSLNSSVSEAFIGENIRLTGRLQIANGTGLENRTVTISWGRDHIVVESASNGTFKAVISFPVGSPSGFATLTAAYEPSGSDKPLYSASSTQIQLRVYYQPTELLAHIGSATVRPLDRIEVGGILTTVRNQTPLVNRTISVQLDTSFIGNATTDTSGTFLFYFNVPATISNGTHVLKAAFNATNDPYAPSGASLPFDVEILATSVHLLPARDTVLSGIQITLNGTVSYTNTTYINETAPPSGNVTIYLDDVPYANATLNSEGAFSLAIPVSLWTASGTHSLMAAYLPDKAWIQGSRFTVSLSVFSTPLIIIAGIAVVGSIFTGSYALRKYRRRSPIKEKIPNVRESEPVHAISLEDFSRSQLIAEITAQASPVSRIKTTYNLAQLMISAKLGLETRDSETPSEYFSRVIEAARSLGSSLRPLVELYELVEYSQFPVEAEQVKDARERLLELREKLESVKPTENSER